MAIVLIPSQVLVRLLKMAESIPQLSKVIDAPTMLQELDFGDAAVGKTGTSKVASKPTATRHLTSGITPSRITGKCSAFLKGGYGKVTYMTLAEAEKQVRCCAMCE